MTKRIESYRFVPLILTLGLAGCAETSSERLASAAEGQAGATLRIGAELPVEDAVYTPHGRHWNAAGIAWNGSAYLMVGSSVFANGSGPNSTLGWRLDSSAQPLDPLPFSLPGAGPVASNGSDYLVTYLASPDQSVRAARISSAGVVMDPSGLALSATSFPAGDGPNRPAVASNGNDYLALWSDFRNGNADIYGARIAASGQVLDAGGFAISTQPGSQGGPSVTWDGARYVVVWNDTRSGGDEVYLARVTSAGAVLDPTGVRIAPGHSPAIASDGVNSLVVWDRYISGIYAARVSQDGNLLGGGPFAITTDRDAISPMVAWTGTSFVTYYAFEPCVGWGGIGGSRVSSDGVVTGSLFGGQRCITYVLGEGVAADGAGRHVFLDQSAPRGDRSYRVLTATTFASDHTLLGSWKPTAANIQLHPQIAHDGNRYFIAWHDLRDTAVMNQVYPVYGARVGADGTTLDRSALSIDPSAFLDSPDGSLISVASNRSNFLVASTRFGIAKGYRVDSAGAVLNTATFTERGYFGGAWLYSHGTEYLATWRQASGNGSFGRRMSEQGALLDQTDIAFVPSPADPAAAVWNGTNYFFVWSQSSELFGAQFTPSGTMVGVPVRIGATVLPFPNQGIPYAGASAGASWDGVNHLVVWRASQDGKPHLYGARVSTAGSVLDPSGFVIASAAPDELSISDSVVAWDGEHHIVTWAAGPWDKRAIHAARVRPSGGVVDAPPVLVSTLGEDPAVASIGNGRALIAYSRYDDSMKYRATRVWVRVLDKGCNCDGGSCESGVCPEPDAAPDTNGPVTEGGDEPVDAGTGGSLGTGGGAGDAGARAGTGGTADAAVAGRSGAAGASSPDDDSGCGCRAARVGSSFGANAVLGLLGLFAARRRVRTRRKLRGAATGAYGRRLNPGVPWCWCSRSAWQAAQRRPRPTSPANSRVLRRRPTSSCQVPVNLLASWCKPSISATVR